MPKELARLIYVLMGTEKLEVQLREASLDDSMEPKIVKFFKDALYIDLKLPNWWNTPERFAKEMKDSRYFKEAMLAKLSEVYRLGAFPKSVEGHLQDQMVELYASLYAPDRSQLQTVRNSRKQSLQRQRNLRMLRAKFEEE